MPRSRKSKSSGGSTADQEANVMQLSKTLGISEEQVRAMLAAQGAGIPTATSGRTSRRSAPAPQPESKPKQNSAWTDFMQDEMPNGKKTGGDSGVDKSNHVSISDSKTSDPPSEKAVDADSSNVVRKYKLPIMPVQLTPGVLAQTGTLDSASAGRDKISASSITAANSHIHLCAPTLIFSKSVFKNVKIAHVASSCSSCHSLAIDVNGVVYGWGRNEQNQLGLSDNDNVKDVMVPRILEGPWKDGSIIDAATGKSHSVVLDKDGVMYAVGLNKNGQCGTGQNVDHVSSWRRCGTTSDFSRKSSDKNKTKFARVSCGESFTVALDDQGLLWSTGSAEFGCIGSGSTGEYFVQANKIAFADANRFELRNTFVTKDEKGNNETLPDSLNIRLGSIACGKYHTVAIEAASEDGAQPRVFSWGSGNFGCLGHRIQADEYYPRLIDSLNSALFTTNIPILAACGASCSMILTKSGHVYYWGKHRSVGDATMYPTLIDVLANNGHVVTDISCGAQTVLCTTAHGQTVSYGVGSYGELGYGSGGPRSSSKPKFIDSLDKCIVKKVVSGYAHTLFILQSEGDEDKKLLDNFDEVEIEDFVDSNGPKKKKQKKK